MPEDKLARGAWALGVGTLVLGTIMDYAIERI